MKYNAIQLFALNVPAQLTLPFDLYAVEVPQHWKELFSRLQQYKLGRKEVLPPVICLNQALQLMVQEILFPSPNAFKLKSSDKWFYTETDKISKDYIVTVVQTWLRVSFEDSEALTDKDIQDINSLSPSDLTFAKVSLPEKVWEVRNDGSKNIELIYYYLIPYLVSRAIASEALELFEPDSGKLIRSLHLRERIVENSSSKEVISWPPEMEVQKRKKKGSKEKEETIHRYSYRISFALHYHPDGTPYLNCEYGIRRWVSWKLGYLKTGVTVCVSPTGTNRFAPCTLKYLGKKKGIDFEGNLVRLLAELNFKDRFTAEEVMQSPYQDSELDRATIYNNRMSKDHYAGAGLFPTDIETFHRACLKRVQSELGDGFYPIKPFVRYETSKNLKKAKAEYKKVDDFFKKHFAEDIEVLPFKIPSNLRLLILAQNTSTTELILLLAKKYGITDIIVENLGELGGALAGKNWETECKQRLQDFQAKLSERLSRSPSDIKTIALIEILPKDLFSQNPDTDPKPCFRPALAMLGCVTDHFTPKEADDKEDILSSEDLQVKLKQVKKERQAAKDAGKGYKGESLISDFARRMETSLVTALTMAGAYVFPTFEAKNFPSNVACVGVYVIPYYIGKETKYLPVAVRMNAGGVTAKAYGCNDWLDFYEFQVKMASEVKNFTPIAFNREKIQGWVFNNLFHETQQPTLFCFDAGNLRTKGLFFLQKKHWCKHALAFKTDEAIQYIPVSKYHHVRVACIVTPDTSEVPTYRACDAKGHLKGHAAGVFYPSERDAECGYYYLSNQRPDSQSGGILNKSKMMSLAIKKGEKAGQLKEAKSSAQGYNPRGILLSLTLQEGDRFGDWASFVQCHRLYGLIHHLGATTRPAALHLASQLEQYRPIQAIKEP